MTVPILITARLRLQPTSFDYEEQRRKASTEEVTRYMTRYPVPSVEEMGPFRQSAIDKNNAGTDWFRDIVSHDQQTWYGALDIRDIGSQDPHIGLWIAEEYQGQGFAYEALRKALDYYFVHYDIPIEYAVAIDNIPSQKLAEKVGGIRVEGRTDISQPKGYTVALLQINLKVIKGIV